VKSVLVGVGVRVQRRELRPQRLLLRRHIAVQVAHFEKQNCETRFSLHRLLKGTLKPGASKLWVRGSQLNLCSPAVSVPLASEILSGSAVFVTFFTRLFTVPNA
jgi:hypothetical protein